MDEELYLHCIDCGESFDTIRTAWEHHCEEDPGKERITDYCYTISQEL